MYEQIYWTVENNQYGTHEYKAITLNKARYKYIQFLVASSFLFSILSDRVFSFFNLFEFYLFSILFLHFDLNSLPQRLYNGSHSTFQSSQTFRTTASSLPFPLSISFFVHIFLRNFFLGPFLSGPFFLGSFPCPKNRFSMCGNPWPSTKARALFSRKTSTRSM